MKKALLFAPILATLVASTSCGTENNVPGDLVPFRSDWITITNWPFPSSSITELNIGGTEESGNYANRGDIEVYYTLPDDRIVVQMRKFTFASNAENAQEDYDRTMPWMYTVANPAPPPDIEESDPSANCAYADENGNPLAEWPDGCSIRVYFEGQSQKLRVGADIRVFLPAAWEGNLNVTTENNDEQEGYPDRGNVKIVDLPGRATVEVDGSTVDIRLADGIEVVPPCTEAQNMECDAADWTSDNQTCVSCLDAGPARVRVTTRGELGVNMTVDAPADYWMRATMDNTQQGLTPNSVPACSAVIDCDGFGGCTFDEEDPQKPWRRVFDVNKPAGTLEGAGPNIFLESGACAELEEVAGPNDYEMPESKKFGDTRLCVGCLGDLEIPAAP